MLTVKFLPSSLTKLILVIDVQLHRTYASDAGPIENLPVTFEAWHAEQRGGFLDFAPVALRAGFRLYRTGRGETVAVKLSPDDLTRAGGKQDDSS